MIDIPINIILQTPGMPKTERNKVPIFEWIEPFVYGNPYPRVEELLKEKGHQGYFYLSNTSVERCREVFPNANIEIRIPDDINICVAEAIKEGNEYFAHLKYVDYWFSLVKSKFLIEVRDGKYNHSEHKMITVNEYMQKNDDRSLEEIWQDTINKCINTILIPGLTQL